MSVGALRSSDFVSAAETTATARQGMASLPFGKWNPESFASQQIWGLVRQVFFASLTRPVRQVVLTAVEPGTDVAYICRQIGEALALETAKSVAVVDRSTQNREPGTERGKGWPGIEGSPLLQLATQVRSNLWILPQRNIFKGSDELLPDSSENDHLLNLRREFEYSIVEGPPAGESSEAVVLARSADGIILVVEAHRTRRAAAGKIKRTLDAADVRVLGIVLSGRSFPIPEGVYRRL